VVCQSVRLFVTRLRCAKTAKRIKVLFGVKTLASLKRSILAGSPSEQRCSEFDAAFADLLWLFVIDTPIVDAQIRKCA